MQNNITQYGDLPLNAVQRITTLIYRTKTYIDTDNSTVMVHRQDREPFAFKPIQNPRHIVQVQHRLLAHPLVSHLSFSDGHYIFTTTSKEDFKGITIWEAAVLLCLNIVEDDDADSI